MLDHFIATPGGSFIYSTTFLQCLLMLFDTSKRFFEKICQFPIKVRIGSFHWFDTSLSENTYVYWSFLMPGRLVVVCVSGGLSIYLSVCLFVCLSVFLNICLSVSVGFCRSLQLQDILRRLFNVYFRVSEASSRWTKLNMTQPKCQKNICLSVPDN